MTEFKSSELPLYHGGCHCGFTTYEVRLSLTEPSAGGPNNILSRCNCSHCVSSGFLAAAPREEDFKLLTPVGGEPELTSYTFNNHLLKYPFCPTCGTNCYARGSVRVDGVEYPIFRLNAQTLKGRGDGKPLEEFKDIPMSFLNGRDETGIRDGPQPSPCPGGLV